MQLDSHKVPFFNKTADLKAGLNQLGLRNASEVLYTSLLPGLNNVSNRIRYYSFYCWLIGEFYKNRESFAENGGYPPTQNGDIRSLLVPLNRRGTGTKVPIFTLSMIVVLKPFRFFGDDKFYIYNAGDIVKHSWSDCRQMPLTTDQASGVVWKFVDRSLQDMLQSLYLTKILGGNDKSKIYPNLVSFKLGCFFTLLSHKRLSETLQ